MALNNVSLSYNSKLRLFQQHAFGEGWHIKSKWHSYNNYMLCGRRFHWV